MATSTRPGVWPWGLSAFALRLTSFVLLAACGSNAQARERPLVGSAPLGMDDVSILLPLPRDPQKPVLAAISGGGGHALVERAWFDLLVTDHHDIAPRIAGPIAFEDFQVVAVRFDLCERAAVGPCPRGADGRIRMVLQPLYRRAGATAAHDVAQHAFYVVPAAELASMVSELRVLAGVPARSMRARLTGGSRARAVSSPADRARVAVVSVGRDGGRKSWERGRR